MIRHAMVLLATAGLAACSAPHVAPAPDAGWSHYGGDAGGQRYSAAAQITRENVKRLKPVWSFSTGDMATKGAAMDRASFEVTPILAAGRLYLCSPFNEASAIDPATGYWYLTEDQGNANTLYRFRPSNAGGGLNSLHAGGQLQGLRVKNVANADMRSPMLCQEYACEWADIADPDLNSASLSTANGNVTASGPYRQAYANGAAIFGANEGCWVANGVVFFTDKQVTTNPARAGRIWSLDLATMTLKAIFVSADIQVGNSPDNLCVSPRGGVLFCEDGGNSGPNSGPAVTQQRLMVVHPNGGSYVFAKNNYNFTRAQLDAAGKFGAPSGDDRNSEWCGACFSPDGRVLFVNLQGPGITLAITGPWASGTL